MVSILKRPFRERTSKALEEVIKLSNKFGPNDRVLWNIGDKAREELEERINEKIKDLDDQVLRRCSAKPGLVRQVGRKYVWMREDRNEVRFIPSVKATIDEKLESKSLMVNAIEEFDREKAISNYPSDMDAEQFLEEGDIFIEEELARIWEEVEIVR